jgi:hypothetical protein
VIAILGTNGTFSVRFSYTITRNPPDTDDAEDIAAVVTGENVVDIKSDDNSTRNALIEILKGTDESRNMT